MAEILVDKAGSGDGFKPGVLYCFDRHLKGPVCSKCLSYERCEKEQEREKKILDELHIQFQYKDDFDLGFLKDIFNKLR